MNIVNLACGNLIDGIIAHFVTVDFTDAFLPAIQKKMWEKYEDLVCVDLNESKFNEETKILYDARIQNLTEWAQGRNANGHPKRFRCPKENCDMCRSYSCYVQRNTDKKTEQEVPKDEEGKLERSNGIWPDEVEDGYITPYDDDEHQSDDSNEYNPFEKRYEPDDVYQ